MITIKEYAESKGVTTQAVYKQLKTHENSLKDHIQKNKGKRWLDDYAVKFLNDQSGGTPIVVVSESENQEDKEKIKELEEQNEQLQLQNNQLLLQNNQLFQKLTDVQQELLAEKDKLADLTAQNSMLLVENTQLESKPTIWQRLIGRKKNS